MFFRVETEPELKQRNYNSKAIFPPSIVVQAYWTHPNAKRHKNGKNVKIRNARTIRHSSLVGINKTNIAIIAKTLLSMSYANIFS